MLEVLKKWATYVLANCSIIQNMVGMLWFFLSEVIVKSPHREKVKLIKKEFQNYEMERVLVSTKDTVEAGRIMLYSGLAFIWQETLHVAIARSRSVEINGKVGKN